ncbi:class I adenylate-forming enzyme family protein [Mycobacterium paraintracellulare]|uniref:class I adenylate-forming enzyme family protein n=1 Tax=Mycobacterium paraintracellulare TaxID=1138383 RepID=UPI001F39FE80|nr:AMP-binding protein [Mycobacterium paraintracellulare]
MLNETFGAALRRAAAEAGDRLALIELAPPGAESLVGALCCDRTWTFTELLREAERCAAWLLQRLEPGDRVCMYAPNVPEWAVLDFGAAMAGMVVVTANPALGSAELGYVVRQSRTALLMHVDAYRGRDLAAVAQYAGDGLCATFSLSQWNNQIRNFDGNVSELPDVRPTDPIQIQYTSGTTGAPKGALLHHRGLLSNAQFIAERAGLRGGLAVSGLPMFHTSGTAMNVLAPVVTRSTAVVPTHFHPDLVLDALERFRGEVLGAVPTMLLDLVEHPSRASRDLSALQVAITGGAPVPSELFDRVEREFGCSLLTLYGQTELSPAITMTSRHDDTPTRATTAGQPFPHVEIKIIDTVTSQTVPLGVEGEICARGPQLMLGYFDMPHRTAETVDAEGWLHTGDLGTMDSRGCLRITGRIRDMIIRGGENIYPAEIESALFEHPSVLDVAVFGMPDDRWGEIVAAAIRLDPDVNPVNSDELQAFCRQRMAAHKSPTRWFACTAFPLTGSGKVQKFRLREQALADELTILGGRPAAGDPTRELTSQSKS